MANWKTFGGTYYYTGAAGSDEENNSFYVRFQYDIDTSTPTYVKCRIFCTNSEWKKSGEVVKKGADYFWVYFPNGVFESSTGSSKVTYRLIHSGTTKEIPRYSTEFYLHKDCFDQGFTVPEFWICNQGPQDPHPGFDPAPFKRGGKRTKYVTKYTTELPYYDGWTPKRVGDGSLDITNNFDNTVTISGTIPSDATWNADYQRPNCVTSSRVVYSINGVQSIVSLDIPTNRQYSITVTMPKPSSGTNNTIEAYLQTDATYNTSKTSTTTLDVHYIDIQPPTWNAGANVTITPSGDRPTYATTYKVSWTHATPANDDSPVTRYICFVYANGNIVATVDEDTDGFHIYGDMPSYGGILSATVYAYTMSLDNDLLAGPPLDGSISVESAGAINVKSSEGSQWHQGIVYVKTHEDMWKESLGVYVKTNEGWQLSI